jgi:hypothetical protein
LVEQYERKVRVLYVAQRGYCALSGKRLDQSFKVDLNHSGIPKPRRGRAAKRTPRAFPNVIDSILNLTLVDADAHMTRGEKRWPRHIAEALEQRLSRDPALSDWMNLRTVHEIEETVQLREYLLREVGAIDTSREDRIIEAMFARRRALA